MTTRTVAIVGAGLAGAKAAEAARAAGFDGRIILIGEETPPYERPPLSKTVLRGEADPGTTRVHPDGFYADNHIDVIAGRVTALDTAARTLTLADGQAVPFDSAVLSTGAEPRRLTVPGSHLDGVHYLRSITDAGDLHDAIGNASRVAVVGAGGSAAESPRPPARWAPMWC